MKENNCDTNELKNIISELRRNIVKESNKSNENLKKYKETKLENERLKSEIDELKKCISDVDYIIMSKAYTNKVSALRVLLIQRDDEIKRLQLTNNQLVDRLAEYNKKFEKIKQEG